MKILIQVFILSALLTAGSCGNSKKGKKGIIEGKAVLKTDKDKLSYAIGLNEADQIMNRIKQGGADTLIDKDMLLKGLNDYFNNETVMSKEEGMKFIQDFVTSFQERQVSGFKAKHSGRKAEAQKFMAENGAREGVITTQSGLQYEVIKKGTGPFIKLNDEVEVNYAGTLVDGSKVDASADHGAPFKFKLEPMGGLIQGWIEGLQLMNKGAKYRFYIPYELGYGEMGKDPKVPPYSVLIFDLEVLSVN